MRALTRQRGMTGIGWLIVLGLIGFFALLTLKMVPSYLEYYKIVATLDSIAEEKGFNSPAEIRDLLGPHGHPWTRNRERAATKRSSGFGGAFCFFLSARVSFFLRSSNLFNFRNFW